MNWGRELTFFCNDAYRPTLGVKHPHALGKSPAASKVTAATTTSGAHHRDWPRLRPLLEKTPPINKTQ